MAICFPSIAPIQYLIHFKPMFHIYSESVKIFWGVYKWNIGLEWVNIPLFVKFTANYQPSFIQATNQPSHGTVTYFSDVSQFFHMYPILCDLLQCDLFEKQNSVILWIVTCQNLTVRVRRSLVRVDSRSRLLVDALLVPPPTEDVHIFLESFG